jgi:hypothetical protein
MNHTKQHLEMIEQQEPVAWYDAEKDCAYTLSDCEGRAQDDLEPLYLAPPSNPWQGLTDEDVMAIAFNFDLSSLSLVAKAIEAKLKEKNT